jgi:hypothetical protein
MIPTSVSAHRLSDVGASGRPQTGPPRLRVRSREAELRRLSTCKRAHESRCFAAGSQQLKVGATFPTRVFPRTRMKSWSTQCHRTVSIVTRAAVAPEGMTRKPTCTAPPLVGSATGSRVNLRQPPAQCREKVVPSSQTLRASFAVALTTMRTAVG